MLRVVKFIVSATNCTASKIAILFLFTFFQSKEKFNKNVSLVL